MRKAVFVAAALLVLLSLVGCDMIKRIVPKENATVGEKVENGGKISENGADVTVVSSSDTSLKVKIENNTDSTWQSGNMRDYRLEVEVDGDWYEVKQVGEFANTMELMIFAPGESLTHTFDFLKRYGRLDQGKYRVVKSFWANATATTEAHEFHLVCEFNVE
jgi:hypothetical protein